MAIAIPTSSQASATATVRASDTDAVKAGGTAKSNGNASVNANAKAGDDASVRETSTQQLNASIVKSSLAVAINAQNEPLALVLKSAITGINEALAPQFGENAIQNAVGQDNSPEGTAGRIVGLSTAFYAAFKEQNKGEDEAVVAQKFIDTIGSGIEQGFKEARDILGGLNVLNGDVASNVDKTYELVQKGLADFAASIGVKQGDQAEAKPPKQPN